MNTKILIIDDNKPIAWALNKAVCDDCKVHSIDEVLNSLAEEKFKNKYDKIIISLESKDGSPKKGIEIIKWLRLLKLEVPIITLSFQNMKTLIRKDPENSLIASPGCELIKKPLYIIQLYKAISTTPKADKEMVRIFLVQRKTIKDLLGEGKHSLSNEFGALKLLEGANLAIHLASIGRAPMGIKKYKKEYKELKNQVSTEDKRRRLKEIEKKYSLIRKKERRPKMQEYERYEFKRDYEEVLKSLEGKNVLLIDDEYDKGWKIILNYLLFKKKMKIKCIRNYEELRKELSIQYLPQYTKIPYDLILLDVRLTDDDHKLKGRDEDYTQLSSLRLLQEIREKDKSVPAVLFTASDKSYVFKPFEEDEELWISGKFIKELPGYPEDYTFQNFLDFWKTLRGVTGYLKEKREIWEKIATLLEKNGYVKKHKKRLFEAYKFLRSQGHFCQENKQLYNYSVIYSQIIIEEFIKDRFKHIFISGYRSRYNFKKQIIILNELTKSKKLNEVETMSETVLENLIDDILSAEKRSWEAFKYKLVYPYDLAWDVYSYRNQIVHNGETLNFLEVTGCFKKMLEFLEQMSR